MARRHQYCLQHPIDIAQHIRIGETDDAEAFSCQSFRPMPVGCFPNGMVIAVNFDDQTEIGAIEIRDIIDQPDLSPEF
nr:hypothetical protein [Sphingobium sp. AS12]